MNGSCSLLLASLADSSKKFYYQAWLKFKTFVSVHLDTNFMLPFKTSTIAVYISFLVQEGYAPSSISSNLSAIAFLHKIFGFDDPSDQFFIKKLLSGAHKLHGHVDTRIPINIDMLKRLIDSARYVCSSAYEISLLRSMYSLMFHGFMRIGEVTSSSNNIQFNHVSISRNSVSVAFHKFKHHSGPPVTITIPANGTPYCPVMLTLAYWAARGRVTGPFFVYPGAIPVQSSHFAKLLSKSLIWAGMSSLDITPHSFRIGAATWAASQGYSEAQIQIMGRWQSNAFRKYIRISTFKIA